MSYQYPSMWRQLHNLGVTGDKILFGIMFPPYPEKFEALFETGRVTVEGKDIIYISNQGEKTVIQSHNQVQDMAEKCLRDKYREKYPMINAIAKMDTKPSGREFGLERGTAIDRYYIERFLEENRELIYGDCLEIADNTYTLKYGADKVDNAYVLHVEGWGNNAIKGNLETGEGIEEGRYDCAIITQTLMFIYDIKCAAENIYKMLKKGGCALVTVSGISQISRYDADLWGSYYNFHEDAMQALFEQVFGTENVEIRSYGNVKTVIAMLYGLCAEDLQEADFMETDKDYPLIISIVLKKK